MEMSYVRRISLRSFLLAISSKEFTVIRRFSTKPLKSQLDISTKLKIEEKWGSVINQKVNFDEACGKQKYLVFPMFPYPSGNLHMGHVRVYTISDAIARFERLNGKNVLHPIGFDSFGLPAENAAIENNVDPEEWTKQNISKMRKQFKKLGCSFDWSREVVTSDPQYYKFTQYLFLLMHKHGLVYRKKAWVNWDPVDGTVLADEQVDDKGHSWRSGAKVEKKMFEQWFIKTTKFAESLRSGLETEKLEGWRDVVKMQKHWIGECNGAEFIFDIYSSKEKKVLSEHIWLSKPEHVSKAAFVAIVNPQFLGLTDSDMPGMTVLNPFTNRRIPVFVVPESDLSYPKGCHIKLGIPSQCDEDRMFALKEGVPFDSTPSPDNFDERMRICQLAANGKKGGYMKSSNLRDWLISRQRRWGTPIPIIHCKECGPVPVKFEDLPVVLPLKDKSPPATCPKCGCSGYRETDTMDTFVDSCWYFLRYIDPFNSDLPFDKDKTKDLMPVDVYIGGKEHATLHLYYARFVTHFLFSLGWLPNSEPFKRLLVQGMVMGKTYYIQETKNVIPSNEVVFEDDKMFHRLTGKPVITKWQKMSKSKHNGVEPSDMFLKYGVDTTRLLILAEVAPTTDRLWKEEAFDGVLNFQDKMWSLLDDFGEAKKQSTKLFADETELKKAEESLWDTRNYFVRGVTFNYRQAYQLSVAISKLQSLVKSLKRYDQSIKASSKEFEKTLAALLIMLAPIAPHFTSELWSRFRSSFSALRESSEAVEWDKNVLEQNWPQLDDEYLLEVFFKVNRAVKGTQKLPYAQFKRLTQNDLREMALSHPDVIRFLGGRHVLNIDYSIVDGHSATLNILVDPSLQARKEKAVAGS